VSNTFFQWGGENLSRGGFAAPGDGLRVWAVLWHRAVFREARLKLAIYSVANITLPASN